MEGDEGFHVVDATTVLDRGFLRLEELSVQTPSGRTTRLALRHPGAVAVLPLDDGVVVMIRQYRAATDRWLLEIPAGTLDVPQEGPEAAAERELAEEVGLRADRLEHLFDFYTAPGFTDEKLRLYVASGLSSVPARPEGPEEQAAEIVRAAVSDVAGLLASGVVEDAKTIIALQWLLASGRT